jgi:carbonic anhydrase/phosphoserine phosphatase
LEERIATFDNDGCLRSEKPCSVQLAFAMDRVKKVAAQHPEWQTEQPFKAVLEDDLDTVADTGMEGMVNLVMAAHAGMTTHEFHTIAEDWLDTARHPRFKRRYHELVYQPMLEVLAHLQANGFKTYITTGGGVEFLRVFAEEVYGIPPEHVIGSRVKTKFEIRNGQPVLVRLPEVAFIDDHVGKPVGINSHIGRRPIASFGNSDNDLPMLQWTAAGPGARLCVLLHHTDSDREWAYGRDSHVGRLDTAIEEAKSRDWTIADMKHDWKVVYPFQRSDHHYFHKDEQFHAANWGYSGNIGPENWGDLNPSYILAKRGLQQSPIDIRDAISDRDLPELEFNYQPSRIRFIYDGHTVQEDEVAGSFTRGPNGKIFNLEQFHFHSPSEHTLNGHQFPMEMHLVHKASDGTVAVLTVLFDEGEHNSAFDPLWHNLPDPDRPNREAVNESFHVRDLLPTQRDYYFYHGSFTTPPCTEHVQWVVLKQTVSVSNEQLTRLRSIIDGNNRPIQRRNGRQIFASQ